VKGQRDYLGKGNLERVSAESSSRLTSLLRSIRSDTCSRWWKLRLEQSPVGETLRSARFGRAQSCVSEIGGCRNARVRARQEGRTYLAWLGGASCHVPASTCERLELGFEVNKSLGYRVYAIWQFPRYVLINYQLSSKYIFTATPDSSRLQYWIVIV